MKYGGQSPRGAPGSQHSGDGWLWRRDEEAPVGPLSLVDKPPVNNNKADVSASSLHPMFLSEVTIPKIWGRVTFWPSCLIDRLFLVLSEY